MLGLPLSVPSQEDTDVTNSDGGGRLSAPFITHTAATPMATPQGSPHELSSHARNAISTVDRAYSLESLEKPPPSVSTTYTSSCE